MVEMRPPEAGEIELDTTEVAAICPHLVAGAAALQAFELAGNPRNIDEEGEARNPDKPAANRKLIRETLAAYSGHFRRVVRTGSVLIASYDDHEEGLRAGRAVLEEVSEDLLAPIWDSRIVPAAQPLRNLRAASNEISADIDATAGDVALRYQLLKTLTAVDTSKDESGAQSHSPAEVIAITATIAGSAMQKQLTAELMDGVYDREIARDILWATIGDHELPSDLARVRQLRKFMATFTGVAADDTAAFYERMAASVGDWPSDQFQAVLGGRSVFQNGLAVVMARAGRWVREAGVMESENPQQAFENSIATLALEFFKRVQVSGPDRALVLKARAQLRRPAMSRNSSPARRTARTEAAPRQEVSREPLRLTTCNLNDHTSQEGVADLVDGFMKKTTPGDTALRSDLEKMAIFMARTDLPPTFRRGIKPIRAAKVRYGEDGKLWDLFEFKPTEAAGLSLRTAVAKNSRIYFIRLSDDELGVVGIEPRAEQDEFLKRVRIKTKQRG